jgi:ribosomal protein S12 methylthiotransferase accessory factor
MWIAGGRSEVEGALLTFDAVRLTRTRHVLTRRPQCSSCGEPQAALPDPALILESRPGTPGTTRRNLRHHVSPLTGLVRGVYPHASGGGGIPVFTAPYNGLAGSNANRNSRAGEPEAAAGKGLTADQAWTSCVAEALERISAGYCGDEPTVRNSWKELGRRAVHPGELLLYSSRQYRKRARWNKECSPENRVPYPFDDSAEVDWCPAWSLRDSELRYLPAAFAMTGYRFRDALRYCWGDSNGCAGGNTIEEAVLHGFLELVERDAAAIWWYNQIQRRAVDVDSFEVPAITQLRDGLMGSGRSVHLLDITTDLKIPCFVATSYSDAASAIGLGYGAHLDPRIAAVRALTELQQCHARHAVRQLEPNGLTVLTEPQVCPLAEPLVQPSDFPRLTHSDIRHDVLYCVDLAASSGMDFVVLNLTRPEIGFPVVRVVAPGLRHFRPRFAPGRLYKVPVAMGWRTEPVRESGLNPEPVPE